jgi:hypothetical protein
MSGLIVGLAHLTLYIPVTIGITMTHSKFAENKKATELYANISLYTSKLSAPQKIQYQDYCKGLRLRLSMYTCLVPSNAYVLNRQVYALLNLTGSHPHPL